jgi:UDP-glucose-4-epimerase GalE
MSILVTGGAGYIGSQAVRDLRRAGREVVVLDSLEFGHPGAVPGVPLVVADIADSDAVASTVREHGVDSVIHFAAYKAAGESVELPGRYFDNNVAKSAALLDTLDACKVRTIVFSSSCSVYGTPSQLPVDESHPLAPESPYAESKLMVEKMLSWYDTSRATRSVSLRYFNAAGADLDGAHGEDWRVTLNLVPLVMKAAVGSTPDIKVFGTDYDTPDGTAIRDYVHVVDLADAHVRAIDYLQRGGASTVVNLGTGRGSSVLEVIDVARQVSGREIPIDKLGRRAGDPVAVYADLRRAADVLGWQAQYGLDVIIESAWRWHSTHPDGYPV